MTADATQKKRRSSRKNTITVRWLISNLGVVFLVLLIVELSVIYTLQHYYYNSAEQYLTTKISSVTTVLTRYSRIFRQTCEVRLKTFPTRNAWN